ncbi:hypothetical protein PBI_GAIA_128 [Mycobacterium phage Gaia]|uniref:Uncharacterized protein n=1 Tax=Mycobacterium phage Gaia TaxID=1486472 RepID=A0A068F1X5_9CAUD|nr:hypothetical protein VC46_gp105 [Mycobacterium phage Gaia]AID58947.1 hypothetical protein PBI_GAIA_128 [Mycobacterium phage Gaia]AYR00064.1 hypothetical protein PBI_NEBKISS_129 [Mycobacterium phage Nebkiss]
MKCVLAVWLESLDSEDQAAFKRAATTMSRADLYGAICAASGSRPFGLTALKQHLNLRCCCN